MNSEQYLVESAKTVAHNTFDYYRFNALNEIGEMLTPLKRTIYHNRPFNRENFIEEAGDILWSFAGLIRITRPFLEKGIVEVLLEKIDTAENDKLLQNHTVDYVKASEKFVKLFQLFAQEIEPKMLIVLGIPAFILGCRYAGIKSISEIMDYNIAKLRKRHGESYNPESWKTREEAEDLAKAHQGEKEIDIETVMGLSTAAERYGKK